MGRNAGPLVAATWVGIVVNTCLTAIKGAAGFMSKEPPLRASAGASLRCSTATSSRESSYPW